MKYYRLAHFVASPNEEMRRMLESETARPSFVMAHGVDTECFSPRWRRPGDGRFCVGYVGRLTPEKNVRALVEIERELEQEGNQDFRILVVGAGSEEEWLRTNLRRAEFSGTLHGDALAAAFAEMDTMVFPSHTDTFGLVVLEAMASGVPVILTEAAGRRVGVVDGESGILTTNFAEGVRRVMQTPGLRERMGETAREHARERGWGRVFENLQAIYRSGLASGEVRARIRRAEERLAVG
jgi:glycosyltransferase involved in cell wall biosynthesis